MKTVVLLFGGASSEYTVSLSSASGVLANIKTDRYELLRVGITREGRFYLFCGDNAEIKNDTWESGEVYPVMLDLSRGTLRVERDGKLEEHKIDAVLPMIHGKNCEDGTLQGMFAVAGIPVVGCECASSAVCMDKAFTKAIVANETKIRQAAVVVVRAADIEKDGAIDVVRERCERELGYPMFIKPSRAGSSVGASKVKCADTFESALREALHEDSKVLIEECIVGCEVEVAVLEENGVYTVAHPAEIDLGGSEFYDYDTKYVSDVSSFHLPARISQEKQDEVRGYAEEIFRALDCRGFSRVDFFYTPEGEFVFNEINTLPGFTPISMYPKMMIAEGISYAELIDRLIGTV